MRQTFARHGALAGVLAVMVPLYAVWCWSGQSAHLGSDPFDYMMMAHHYAPYTPRDAVFAHLARESRFPPLYPALLAAFGGAANWVVAHEITLATLLLGLLALHAWMLEEGASSAAGAAAVLWSLLVPQTWITGLSIQSEYPYLCFSVCVLWMSARHRRTGQWRDLALAALAVAAAALTRTIGIALFAALLPGLLKAPRRQALGALLIAAGPLAAWHFAHRPEQAYEGAMLTLYRHHPLEALSWQLRREIGAMRAGWCDDFLRLPFLAPACLMLGLSLLPACLLRAAAGRADGLYALAYLGIVLVWPYPEEAGRFLWPLIPVVFAQGLLVLRPWLARGVREWVSAAALCAFLLLMLPALSYMSMRYRAPASARIAHPEWFLSWYGSDLPGNENRVLSQVGIMQAMAAIADQVPPGECVLSVLSEDAVYLSRRWAVEPPLNSVPSPEFERRLLKTGCRYVFMLSAANPNYAPMFPWDRIRSRAEVLDLRVIPGARPADAKTVTLLARLKD